MSHPVRIQEVGPFKFYRLGHTFIADRGVTRFVATRVRTETGFSWEATERPRRGKIGMPTRGDYFPSLRAAAEYLLPAYLES